MSRPAPKTRMDGEDRWDGWWIFPAALLLVTTLLIIAAVAIQGRGADADSPAAGQTTPAVAAPGGP